MFEAFNQYFDKIYIVTLEGYEDRHKSIEKYMAGLDYTLWWGTDKRKLPQDILQDTAFYDDAAHRHTKRTTRSMNLGELGCADSHRRIYQDAVENQYRRVAIFEDDAVPNPKVLANFAQQMATLPQDWDTVIFDYYDAHFEDFKGKLKQATYKMFHKLHIANWHKVPVELIDQMLMRDFNQYFYLSGRFSGSHAYAVSLNAAKKYLAYQTPIKLQADRIFYYHKSSFPLHNFACKEPMFLQGEVAQQSTIQFR
ncbi:glycosyltransferase family 25 protein [Glaciecola sp. 1036]|uniref:glycosyltransferase family 25 protein n=1 Tax=Alteromonadaceae TaxID=72275 RepID=UPI003D02AA21